MRKNKIIGILLLLAAPACLADDSSAPQKKVTLQDLIQNAAGSPTETPAVAGVRGLEETNGPIDTKARDYAVIDRLEHLGLHEDELKAFLDEGKLQ